MTATTVSLEAVEAAVQRARARLDAKPEMSATRVAIADASQRARAQLEAERSELPAAMRALADAILSGSTKRQNSVDALRSRVQRAADAVTALEQLSAETERDDLRAESHHLTQDREALVELRRRADDFYDYQLGGTPTFSHEKTDELKGIEAARREVSSYLLEIDGRIAAIGRRELEIAAALEVLLAGALRPVA